MMIVASAKPDGMFAQAWWIFQDNIPLFWYGIKTVSYTHLDVYKRQV